MSTWRCDSVGLQWLLVPAAIVFGIALWLGTQFQLRYSAAIAVTAATATSAFLHVLAASNTPRLRLNGTTLEVIAPWTKGQSLPVPTAFHVGELDIEAAETFNYPSQARPELWPQHQLNMPFISSHGGARGCYALANGRHAHVFLPLRGNVVYLPIQSCYALLVSLRQPREFLQSLHNARGGSPNPSLQRTPPGRSPGRCR